MKHIVKFILFILYSIGMFALQTPWIMFIGLGINLVCMLYRKISITRAIQNLWSFMGFIVFTGVINICFVDMYYGSTIAIKLMLVCNMTYIFASSMTNSQFAQTIVTLLMPLKIFRINTENIGIMIMVSLSFLPILKNELQNIQFSLKAKAMKTDAFHLVLYSKWILLPMLISILKRVNEMEEGLKAKAYISE